MKQTVGIAPLEKYEESQSLLGRSRISMSIR
jgi:hypothetical protein